MASENMEQKCKTCRIVFAVCLVVTIGLLLWGFLTPPTGEIDGSVLKGAGILFGYAALATGAHAINLGYDLKVSHGDTELNINNNHEEGGER